MSGYLCFMLNIDDIHISYFRLKYRDKILIFSRKVGEGKKGSDLHLCLVGEKGSCATKA
jgi:hypothetical protein